MTIEIKVPVLPESVADATIATWHVKAGDSVKRDQNLVDIETDKVVLEVVAPADGVIGEIIDEEGATVLGEQVIAKLEEGGAAPAKSESKADAEPAKAEAPAPLITTFTSPDFLFEISNALISAADVIIAVPC